MTPWVNAQVSRVQASVKALATCRSPAPELHRQYGQRIKGAQEFLWDLHYYRARLREERHTSLLGWNLKYLKFFNNPYIFYLDMVTCIYLRQRTSASSYRPT